MTSRPIARVEASSMLAGIAGVAILSLRPTAVAGLMIAAVCGPFGFAVGQPGAAARLVLQGLVAFFLGCWVHETAHLLALRRAASRRGGVEVSLRGGWLSVQVVAPDDLVTPWAAAAGPLAGASACVVLGMAGMRPALAVALGAMHLVNLTALCPDGRVIRDRLYGVDHRGVAKGCLNRD